MFYILPKRLIRLIVDHALVGKDKLKNIVWEFVLQNPPDSRYHYV